MLFVNSIAETLAFFLSETRYIRYFQSKRVGNPSHWWKSPVSKKTMEGNTKHWPDLMAAVCDSSVHRLVVCIWSTDRRLCRLAAAADVGDISVLFITALWQGCDESDVNQLAPRSSTLPDLLLPLLPFVDIIALGVIEEPAADDKTDVDDALVLHVVDWCLVDV